MILVLILAMSYAPWMASCFAFDSALCAVSLSPSMTDPLHERCVKEAVDVYIGGCTRTSVDVGIKLASGKRVHMVIYMCRHGWRSGGGLAWEFRRGDMRAMNSADVYIGGST